MSNILDITYLTHKSKNVKVGYRDRAVIVFLLGVLVISGWAVKAWLGFGTQQVAKPGFVNMSGETIPIANYPVLPRPRIASGDRRIGDGDVEFSKIERTTSREPLAISENPLGLVAIIRNTGKLLAEVEYNLVHVNPQDFCRRVAIIFGFNDEGVAAIEDHFDEEPSSFGSNKGLRVLGSGIGSVFGRLHIATHQVSLASEYLGLEQKKKRLDESADGDHASESHGQSVNARAGIFLGLNLGGLAIGLFGSLVVPYRRQRLQFCLFGIGGICMALGMIYWLRPMT